MKKYSWLFKSLFVVVTLIAAHFINNWIMLALIILYIALLIVMQRYVIYYVKANKSYAEKDISASIKWFDRAYNIKNCSAKVKAMYGFVLLKNGQVSEAESVLKPLLNAKISSDEKIKVKSYWALLLWKKGNLDEAISIYEDILNTYKTTNIYSNLGYLLILQGDIDKAFKINLEAYEYNDSDNIISDNLGYTYYLKGEYEKAKAIYEKLIPKEPQFPEAYYDYALILLELNDKEKALNLFKKSLDYNISNLSILTKEKIKGKIEEIENK